MQLERDARICVVDDNRLDREQLRDALAGLGHIELFEDAEAALRSIVRQAPDVVVTDCVMPGMSGTQLLERIRRQQPGVDVLFVTAAASVETAVAAMRMGACDYLQKPIEAEQLRRVVEQALMRRRLIDENQRLRNLLRTLEACRSLAPCLEPGEVYPVALDLLLSATARSRGLGLFRRTTPPQNDGIAFRGLTERQAQGLRRMLIDEKQVELGLFCEIARVDNGPILDALRDAGVDTRQLIAVPVRSDEREGGVLWVIEDGEQLDEGSFELLLTIQRHAEVALRNAERYALAKERAFIDDVTEVYNARYLLSTAENEIRRAERYGNPLSVVFLDLDRFKLVNDNHGHLVGSQTLRNLSKLLLECIRQVDTLARYGGDEFTILLPDTPHDAAMAVAERIRRYVEDYLFEGGDAAPLRLTISAGVSSFPEHGQTREELLDAADKAMYRAKSLGRNRSCSANELAEVAADV
jgi:diguanylate cyclase (GGDEF)-like protein